MKRIYFTICMTIGLLVLTGCRLGDGSSKLAPLPSDSLYNERDVYQAYATQPKLALAKIDSAVMLGHMSDYRARYLRTMIYCRSYDECHLDSVIILGEQLLRHDSVVNNPDEQENVLDLLINACRIRCDYNLYLHWSTQKGELCRSQGEEVEFLRTEAEIALALFKLGRSSEGMEKIDRVIDHLDKEGSIDRMDAFFVAVKRKINMLNSQNRPAEVIPLTNRILDRFSHYQQHPDSYAEDSYRLPPVQNDRNNYLDFVKGQTYAFLAEAYANTGDRQQARHYIQLFSQSRYSQNSGGKEMIIATYQKLGDLSQVAMLLDDLTQRMGTDTVNAEYTKILRTKAIVADARGQVGESRDYWHRYADLSNVLHDSLQASRAQEYAAIYHSQEQQLELAHVKTRWLLTVCIAIAALLVALLAIAFSVYFYKQKKHEHEKNMALGRKINQLLDTMEHRQATVPNNTTDEKIASELKSLYDKMSSLINEERLYANTFLQRQDILNLMGISRTTLNQMLNMYANGLSFPAYINAIRLKIACEMLRQASDKTVTAIAEEVGLTQHNLHRLFKQHFNQTPMQYRQAHSK